MSTAIPGNTYSIREAAALTGLPASTLRYSEAIGVIEPMGRGASSKDRVLPTRTSTSRPGSRA